MHIVSNRDGLVWLLLISTTQGSNERNSVEGKMKDIPCPHIDKSSVSQVSTELSLGFLPLTPNLTGEAN